jgi:chromosomal replication initiation ATPase DnaA
MSQFALPLAYRSAHGESDFFVSAANAEAVGWLDRWPDWPGRALVLTGPEAAGKSHLSRIFSSRVGAAARVVDDADRNRDEAMLFHAWNAAQAGGPGLLVVARTPPSAWSFALPDLESRLRSTMTVEIAAPDDALLAEVVAKHFRDRGLRVPPSVINYIIPRIERSFAAAERAVGAIDAAAMAGARPVSVPLVRAALRFDWQEEFDWRGETERDTD